MKGVDIEIEIENLNKFLDKCRDDKQYLMIKEICDFKEKLNVFRLQYND